MCVTENNAIGHCIGCASKKYNPMRYLYRWRYFQCNLSGASETEIEVQVVRLYKCARI